jgi:hypothetical protein
MERLQAVWKINKKSAKNNTLLKSILQSFMNEYIYLMILGLISCSFYLFQPFLITATVNYIQNGENALDDYGIKFIDFQNTYGMKWLRQDI